MWPDFIAFQASSANKRPNRRRTVIEAERLFKAYLEPLLGKPREVPLAWDAVAALRGLSKVRGPKDYVFGSDKPFRQHELRDALRRAKRAAGLDSMCTFTCSATPGRATASCRGSAAAW